MSDNTGGSAPQGWTALAKRYWAQGTVLVVIAGVTVAQFTGDGLNLTGKKLTWDTAADGSFKMETIAPVYDGTTDNILVTGYNYLRPKTTEPAFYFGLEANYEDALHDHYMEWNGDYRSSDGATFKRFLYFQVNRATHLGIWRFQGQFFQIADDTTGLQFQFWPVGTRRSRFQYLDDVGSDGDYETLAVGGNSTNGPDTIAIGPHVISDRAKSFTVTGDGIIAAPRGFRRLAGPFVLGNIPANTSASMWVGQASTVYYVPMRDSSVTGLTVRLDQVAAGDTLVVQLWKNGGAWIAGCTVAVAGLGCTATWARGTNALVAGDTLLVRLITTVSWTSTTADATAFVEYEE